MQMDFTYLILLTGLHLVMWVPYIVNMIMRMGLIEAMSSYSSTEEDPLAPWAQRMKKAHYNSVENYILFAALTFITSLTGKWNPTIADASMIYVVTRLIHFLAYTFAIPYVRTLAFFANIACLAVMLLSLI